MSDLAHLKVWADPAIRDSLLWYLDVAENRRPAKFRIAATLATHLDPTASSEEALWAELDRLTPIFVRRWQAIRTGASLPATADGPSLLEVCRELAYRMLTHCNFCPWNCRVDRMAVPNSVPANSLRFRVGMRSSPSGSVPIFGAPRIAEIIGMELRHHIQPLHSPD